MLQLQYYNSKLTKTQIDKILNNYNIKYTTVKNEIDSKVNNLLKLFMSDILTFLENIEEISKERKKLKDFENIQKECELLSSKLKEKTINEHKLENDIESLQKEIEYLKSENKNQLDEIIELKTPTTTRYKPKVTFTNKKHLKIKTDYLNTTFNEGQMTNRNAPNTSNYRNYNSAMNKNPKSKTYTQNKNNKLNKTMISSSANKRKIIMKSTDKSIKDKKSLSPDIVSISKKNIINNSNTMNKTIEKIKKYNMNRYRERIKKMNYFRTSKNKGKFKNKMKEENINSNRSTNSNSVANRLEKYKKNALSITKGKCMEKEKEKNSFIKDEDDELEKDKTFEYAERFLTLVESIPAKETINANNYSEDDNNSKNHSKTNSISSSSSSSSSSEIEDSYNAESVDNEIKELEEDENNILEIINQIKDLNILT